MNYTTRITKTPTSHIDSNTKRKLPKISKFSLICYFSFFAISIIARFLFPAGDEPDYFVRLSQIVDSHNSISVFHPYYYLTDFITSIPLEQRCSIETSPLQLSAYIHGKECMDSLYVIINRLIITFVSSLVFIIPTVFRRFFFTIFSSIDKNICSQNYNFRCDIISITVLLPSSIYYLGVVSLEQFVYCITLVCFLVYDSWLLIPFLLWALAGDFGSAVVLAGFIVFFALGRYLYKRFGFLKILIYWFATLISSYLLGTIVLLVVGKFFPYLLNIFNAYQEYYSFVYEKYPIILRPVVTFMSFSFMTAQSLKPFIIVYFIFFIIVLINIKLSWSILNKKHKKIKHHRLIFEALGYLTSIFFISSLTFILPGYSNYKYYVFFSPFFTAMTVNSYNRLSNNYRKSKFSLMLLFMLISIIVFISLLSFYILKPNN